MTQGLALQSVAARCDTDKKEKTKWGGVRLNVSFNTGLMLAVLFSVNQNSTLRICYTLVCFSAVISAQKYVR